MEERREAERGRIGQKEERMGLVEGGSSIVDPLFPSDIMLILLHFFWSGSSITMYLAAVAVSDI